MMELPGPARNILLAEDKVLPIRTVLNRQARLCIARRAIGIVPVIRLAACNLRCQIGRIVSRLISRQRVQMRRAVAPVAKRRIPVHPDEIHIRACP